MCVEIDDLRSAGILIYAAQSDSYNDIVPQQLTLKELLNIDMKLLEINKELSKDKKNKSEHTKET